MPISHFDDLVRSLREIRSDVVIDDEARVIELSTRVGALCLRWDEGLPFVHIVVALYSGVRPGSAGAVERLIACYNHQLPLPGLSLDHASGLVYFRWVMTRGAGFELDALAGLLQIVVDEIETLKPFLDRDLEPAAAPVPGDALHEITAWLAV